MLPSTAIYNPPRLSYLKSLDESRKVCTPYRGDNEFSILGDGNYTFKTVSLKSDSSINGICNKQYKKNILAKTGVFI